jgi:hypothetical protein
MWGVPITLIGIWPQTAWTVVCLAVVGAGNAVLDIAGFTLIQRGIDNAVLARVFGVFEVLAIAALGAGSIVGSLLVDQLGPRSALVVAGSILPVLTIFTFPRLRAIDAAVVIPERQLRMLQSIPLFSPLPPRPSSGSLLILLPWQPLREPSLCVRAPPVTSSTSSRQDMSGLRGRAGASPIWDRATTSARSRYSETYRGATCTATTNVELYTIDRERFVSAVTGNNTSASEIESVIHRRLGGLEAVA